MSTPAEPGRQTVMVVLAVGLVTALCMVTAASLWVAVAHKSDVSGGLSENATQVLNVAFGGIIGVLGSYVGYRAGAARTTGDPFTNGQAAPYSPGPATPREVAAPPEGRGEPPG